MDRINQNDIKATKTNRNIKTIEKMRMFESKRKLHNLVIT